MWNTSDRGMVQGPDSKIAADRAQCGHQSTAPAIHIAKLVHSAAERPEINAQAGAQKSSRSVARDGRYIAWLSSTVASIITIRGYILDAA